MSDEQKKTDDDIIDLHKLKNSITSFFTKKDQTHHEHPHPEHHHETNPTHHEPHHTPQSDDSISIDFQKIKMETKKHAKWIIPLICILIAMSFSIYFRTMPQRMPIANDWAENAVLNFYTNQVQAQVNQQYPNLPQQNKDALVQSQLQTFKKENKELLDSQTTQLAEQYRNNFRNDQGTLYLLGIDPYYYYRQTEFVLSNGFPGTSIKPDGTLWDDERLAPIGREAEWGFHHWFGAKWHQFLNLFGEFPLMFSFFFVGTIFSALTVIPAFFIGRRLTKNNVGGFFTAMLIAVSGFFVARTTGESSDTDVYSVFFPVLIAWLFIEAMEASELKKKIMWISLAGFATGVFAFAWTGWWYIATFILVALLVHVAYLLLTHWNTKSTFFKSPAMTSPLTMIGIYCLSSAIFISIFSSFNQFIRILKGPFQFISLKAVAVNSFWPNIRTTVAELNVASFTHVIEQLGGNLLLTLAIAGIIILLLQKNKEGKRDILIPFFLAVWLAASFYATTKGVRFILQITPVFSITLGICMGLAWHYSSTWISKELKLHKLVTQIIMFAILALLLIEPIKSGYSQSFNSVPSVNDEWYNALTKIKTEAPENIIITSWWDFGHWFKAMANRPVTFDGGTQTYWGAHWVGKSLLTTNEKNSVGIVRMLNCGQNNAFIELDKIMNNTPKSIDIINRIVVLSKPNAIQLLQQEGLTAEQSDAVVQYTHCDSPPVDYYITSEDMVGKAGVWGHFGSWDFNKAVMYQKTKNLEREQAATYLVDNFSLTTEKANQIYGEIQSTDADRWIAPWPGYISGWNSCQRSAEKEIRCLGSVQGQQFALRVNLENYNASFEGNSAVAPNSIVYATKESIVEKQLEGQKTGFSIILVPEGDNYKFMIADPLQANSMFAKLFFMEGHGQKCFQKFDDVNQGGFRIITWIVDYSCQQENKIYFLPQEQVHASHILISTQGRSEAEALALVESIQQNITTFNFAEYAAQYSEDSGSKQNGGDLGWFKKGQMVTEFEQTAFSLAAGKISEPVKTQFGYHLIYVMEKREE